MKNKVTLSSSAVTHTGAYTIETSQGSYTSPYSFTSNIALSNDEIITEVLKLYPEVPEEAYPVLEDSAPVVQEAPMEEKQPEAPTLVAPEISDEDVPAPAAPTKL